MTHYRYERLSAQDAGFLVFESPTVPFHVAATLLFEAGPLTTEDGGIDIEAIKKAMQGVLHLLPRYRQKLAWIPVVNHPVWVDDRDFNIDYHIRHTALPQPGGMEQLKDLISRVVPHPLDRSRPLWEVWVAEGLEGDRFAVITKIHHCMMDGEAGVDIANILLSTDPEHQPADEVPAYIPRPAPSALELVRDDWLHKARLPLQVARGLQHFVDETQSVAHELAIRVRALAALAGWAVRPTSETPINGPLGPHRRFEFLTMELDDVKAVRKALGCTVNDVVLTTVAGAVREFLIRRRVRPDEIDFRISAPVNVRQEEDKGRLGNRVSSWIVQLPVGEADPLKRMEVLREVTRELKASKQAIGVTMMMELAEWTPTLLISLGARAVSSPINMIVTNVPGPQFPLYLLGAKMLGLFPVVPLLEGTGLAVGLFSYNGKVFWGFNADYGLVPDLPAFRRVLVASFRELQRAAGLCAGGGDTHELRSDPGDA
jgi:diacylglycerol O-acyltransferase